MRAVWLTFSLMLVLQWLNVRAGEAALRTVALTGQQAPGAPGSVSFQFLSPPVIDGMGRTAFSSTLQGAGVTTSNDTGIWSEGSGALTLLAREGSPAPGTPDSYEELPSTLFVMNRAGQTAIRAATSSGAGIFSDRSGTMSKVAVIGDPVHSPEQEAHTLATVGLPVIDDSGRVAFYGLLSGQNVTSNNDEALWKETASGLQRVVREGEFSGVPDARFDDDAPFRAALSQITMNASGQLAFHGLITGGGEFGNPRARDDSIHIHSSGLLLPLAVEDDPAPGTTAMFSTLRNPVLNNAAQVAFDAHLVGSGVNSSNDEGIWVAGGGTTIQPVARDGSPAPGTGLGVVFSRPSGFDGPVINGAGEVAFLYGLTGTGVTSENDRGIWSGTPGNLALVAREGGPAPGVGPGVTFQFSPTSPSINGQGQVIFAASIAGPGVNFDNNLGLWAQDASGNLQLVVRTGQTIEVAPGDPRTVSGIGLHTNAFGAGTGNQDGRSTYFNDSGLIAFRLNFTNGTSGNFVADIVASAASLSGDYNGDGSVDAADYVLWRKHLGTNTTLPNDTTPGSVMPVDYTVWQGNFGATSMSAAAGSSASIPEPGAFALLAVGACVSILGRRRKTIAAQ